MKNIRRLYYLPPSTKTPWTDKQYYFNLFNLYTTRIFLPCSNLILNTTSLIFLTIQKRAFHLLLNLELRADTFLYFL